MSRVFIEMSSFRKRVDDEGPDAMRLIQDELLENLEGGQVIQGTGGLRKLRVADDGRNKGKRGGYRVTRVQFRSATLDGQGVRYDEARCQDYTST